MLKTAILFVTILISLVLKAQNKYELQVLGTVQDGGAPHISCTKTCCLGLSTEEKDRRKVSSLSIKNATTEEFYIFDATPDFSDQIAMINSETMPSGIFLSHAHIGHYTGLMYLGREAKGASKVPVYAMPRMIKFLRKNGPWSQLVTLENIELRPIKANQEIKIAEGFSVIPLLVPHRDEFSETVGFEIHINEKVVLFIPDINKWQLWNQSIAEKVKNADYAFLDATFYDQNEVKRDMSEIPHPFVVESMKILKDLTPEDKAKVHFIHLNHSNPLLDNNSSAYKEVLKRGFKIAEIGQKISF